MRRPFLIGGLAVAVIGIGVATGAAVLLHSHHAPPPLALSATQPPSSASALDGRWTVGPGSLVGYRVKEKFINQPAETEAVARTSNVRGGFALSMTGSTIKLSGMDFTVDLASLTSQDKYANYQVYQRDFFVQKVYLETDSFPMATFTADVMPFAAPTGGRLDVDVQGKLTVHGTTRPVTAHVQAQSIGTGAPEVAGSMTVDMRDFGIAPPDISFTRAEPAVMIEFDLKLTHA